MKEKLICSARNRANFWTASGEIRVPSIYRLVPTSSKKKSRTHNCFCSDWLKLLDCFVTCATFSGDPMHRRKLHAKLNWNYHVTPLFIHSMHLSFCSIPTFRSECLKYLGRWKKLKDNELFDNLRTDLLFQFWHFLVFEDGYAFSQEEHGAVRQGDMVRAYDTTLPSRAMDKL